LLRGLSASSSEQEYKTFVRTVHANGVDPVLGKTHLAAPQLFKNDENPKISTHGEGHKIANRTLSTQSINTGL